MNAYLVRTSEVRSYVEPVLDDGSGPTFDYWPTSVFLAETPGQAKADALREWAKDPKLAVYADDWPNLRVRILFHDVRAYDGESGADVEARRGELVPPHYLYEQAWGRVHEVFDHEGAACDCEVVE